MRSFTSLVGTTSANANPGSFCDLSQNNSSNNVSLGKILINQQHRYYLQKYFDNERTYTGISIGAQKIVLPATPVVGDLSATMSVAWPYMTCQQLVVFGDGEQRTVKFTQNSTSITWTTALFGKRFTTTAAISAGDTSATLSTAWTDTTQTLTVYFSDGSSKSITFTNGSTAISWAGGLTGAVEAWVRTFPSDTTISTVGVQAYPINSSVSKIKNATITIGQLVYTPSSVQTIQEWTQLNALPYTSDIPNQFYLYQNQVMFWPIPSSTGNIITFNYQTRVADMTYDDFSTGTVTIAVGSNSVTGSGTNWNSSGTYPLNVDLSYSNLMISVTPPKGDGLYYPIQQFTSNTNLLLNSAIINAPTTSGDAYLIGQYPLLHEDFHDLLVYSSLAIYYSSIVKDKDRFALYDRLTKEREKLMEAYLGTKTVQVDLGQQPVPYNPNLFLFAPPKN